MKCPDCRGLGILWNVPIRSLAVVRLFPNLHGFGDRVTKGTTDLRCQPCKGTGSIAPRI